MKNLDGIHGQLLIDHLFDGVGRDRVALPVDGALRHNDDVQPLTCLPANENNFKTPQKQKLEEVMLAWKYSNNFKIPKIKTKN